MIENRKITSGKCKYDSAIVHVGINDIFQCKNESELEELPTNIIEIGKTTSTCNWLWKQQLTLETTSYLSIIRRLDQKSLGISDSPGKAR